MIAQIKTLANASAIETAQKQYQAIAQENAVIEKDNAQLSKAKRGELKTYPTIPDAEYKNSDLLLKEHEISLAFVNSTGEISIKYQGDNFNLVYSDIIWNQLKEIFS